MLLTLVKRHLLKRPFLNSIKLTGLVIALSSLILIALYLKYELSFDRFHSAADRIYRFTITSPAIFSGKHFARVPNPEYIPEMAETFPGIKQFVRLSPMAGGIIQWHEKRIFMSQAFVCDSTFFKVFDADLLVGNTNTVLEGPGSMVISESFAKKIFGSDNPVGQILTIPEGRYFGEKLDFTVKGIMEDFPDNSHFHPEFIATPVNRSDLDDWAWTYLLLKKKADPADIISSFSKFYASYYDKKPEEVDLTAHLQKIRDIHLHSKKTREIEGNSSILVVYSFSAAAMILLFIALVNYSNLNLGMAVFSDKYLYVSRVFGASRRRQLSYFATEGFIMILMALICSIIIVGITNSVISSWFNINLLAGNIPFIAAVAVLVCLLGFLSGFLPLLRTYFSGIVSSARDISGGTCTHRGINRALILFQYAIAVMLIIAVVVIHRQTAYALRSGIGSENKNVICMDRVHSDIVQRFPEFKKALLEYPSIRQVSAMIASPGEDVNDMFRFTMEGYEADEIRHADNYIGIFPCDYSFASLFGLNFLAGRDFSEKFTDNEGSGEYIINESAMRRLHYTHPADIIGTEFQLFFHTDAISIPAGRIVGVVQDFHISSLKREIEPLVLFKRSDIWLNNLVVSFSPGMQKEALKDLENVWNEMFPEYTFRYDFVDSIYRKVYLSERLQATLLMIFTVIALFICSMGLLGMSLLAAQRRIKEVGIRVVNGAGVMSIMTMLNWDFLKWILLSFLPAFPLAYIAMRRWMEEFIYKTDLSWWIYVMAGLTVLLISGVTVSIQSWRAARKNPVEILRYE
jgi:putative ABC transport system permease protein